MTKLSENFDSKEFQCKCCGKLPDGDINPQLINLLQAIREKIDKPIIILSGFRCEKHNHEVGGAKHSQHVLGNAADIKVSGMEAHDVHEYIANHFNQRTKGLGKYNTFTHVDVRGGANARWSGA